MPPKQKAAEDSPDTVQEESNDQSVQQDSGADENVERLAAEVLGGLWGDHHAARVALTEAGHEASKVLTRVNARMAGGAPSAHPAEPINLLQEVRDGEWGAPKGLYQRLAAAGFSQAVVDEVRRNLEAS